MTLKLGIQHQREHRVVLEYYHVFSNDEPGLSLTIFIGSNLFHNASAWLKAYAAFSAHVFPSLF